MMYLGSTSGGSSGDSGKTVANAHCFPCLHVPQSHDIDSVGVSAGFIDFSDALVYVVLLCIGHLHHKRFWDEGCGGLK